MTSTFATMDTKNVITLFIIICFYRQLLLIFQLPWKQTISQSMDNGEQPIKQICNYHLIVSNILSLAKLLIQLEEEL